MRRQLCILLGLLLCLNLSGCQWLKDRQLNFKQGNIVKEKTVKQLKIGMSKADVTSLLGSPVLTNPFDPNRFEYVQATQIKGKTTVNKRLIILFKGDRLTRFFYE